MGKPIDPIASLVEALELTDTGARTSEDIFTGPSQWMPAGRVFGGQVLAQSLVAAMRTLEADRIVHSMHGYFLRPGDIDKPITFAVDRVHDGRSFSARRVQAYQDAKPILSMIASFQTADEGVEHQLDMPAGLAQPEDLASDAVALSNLTDPVARYWAEGRAFEMRHLTTPVYLQVEGDRVAHQCVWIKAKGTLPDDENLHRAALAYASDYSILESVFRRHGLSWSDSRTKVASLDHAMWWHRFGRVDEWLLYAQESPSATGGRGLSQGRIYARDGALLASIAQEGMVRVARSTGSAADR